MADYSSWAVRSVRFIWYIRISLHWISALPLVIDVLFGIDALYTGPQYSDQSQAAAKEQHPRGRYFFFGIQVLHLSAS